MCGLSIVEEELLVASYVHKWPISFNLCTSHLKILIFFISHLQLHYKEIGELSLIRAWISEGRLSCGRETA